MSARSKSRKEWVPPLIFAATALVFALLGDFLGVIEKVYGWLRAPDLPTLTERYLIINLETEGDLRAKVEKLTTQLSGVRFVQSKWLTDDAVSTAADTARKHFCNTNEFTMVKAFATPDEPRRVELMEKCLGETSTRVRLGTYALQSHDPKPLNDLVIDLAELWTEAGAMDGYDGFLNGKLSLSPACFHSSGLNACIATQSRVETLHHLGPLATGETLVVPLYLVVLLEWPEYTHDGLVVTPAFFPSEVRLGERILIEVPREMNETPTISVGVYEGRG